MRGVFISFYFILFVVVVFQGDVALTRRPSASSPPCLAGNRCASHVKQRFHVCPGATASLWFFSSSITRPFLSLHPPIPVGSVPSADINTGI